MHMVHLINLINLINLPKLDRYTAGWIFWLLWFVIEEGASLVGPRNGRTLSEHVWSWFAVKDKGWQWRLRRVLLLGFMAWLTVHFVAGGVYAIATIE